MLSVFMCFYQNLALSLNTMLIVETHCSDVSCEKYLVPQVDRKIKPVKEKCHEKFLFAISTVKTRYVQHQKYQNL